jgi:hypothetical protein
MVVEQKHPFIVLDQNVMRDCRTLSLAWDRCRFERLQLLIPHVAGFEFSKGSKQFDTWRRSLEYVCKYPEFVSVARKITNMLDEERLTGQPCRTVVEQDATVLFRQLLDGLAHEDFSTLNEMIDGPIRRLMPKSLAVWNDSEQHHQWIGRIRNGLQSTMSKESLRKLRSNPDAGLFEWLSSDDAIRFVFQGINSQLNNDVVSLCLASSASVSASFTSGFAAVAIYWLAFRGLDEAAPEKSTNDLLDIEYATLGSLSVSLLSNDKRLNTIYQAMSTAVSERQVWFRTRAWEKT